MKSYVRDHVWTEQEEIAFALRQLKVNVLWQLKKHPQDQHMKEIIETLCAMSDAVIDWMDIPGSLKITVSIQPKLFDSIDGAEPETSAFDLRNVLPGKELGDVPF